MAILTHKLMAKSPRDTDFHCVGVYDSEDIALREMQRWEVCFALVKFKVEENR